MRKKIAVACRDLGNLSTGVQKTCFGFTQELVRYREDYEIHLYYSQKQHLQWFPEVQQHYMPMRTRLLWDHLLLPLALKRDKVEYAIFPKGTKSLFSPCRDLVIIHDLGYFYPQFDAYQSLDTIYMKWMMPYSARQAWGVFTVSEATKQDVIRFLLPGQSEKVQTILNNSTFDYQKVTAEKRLEEIVLKYKLELPFVFYPTSISPRKNILRLLEAWDSVSNEIPHHLYLTGNKSWKSAEIEQQLAAREPQRVHLLGKVTEEDMPSLYSLADFVVYVSLFEGFGLPVLEAMRCGVPVLAANTSSIPEVSADAALYVDPYSQDQIASGLRRMAEDRILRETLIERGYEQARKFSWERTVSTALKWIETHSS